ncbi:MAG: single-stranded DNA-binding protein [Patescibacteria group bacterium]
MNFNKAIIAGNLTDDPEKRATDSGTTVVNFSVATNRYYSNQSGERQQDTEYHDVVFFGKTAENIAKYLSKGSSVLIEGRLQTRSWEGQDGNTRYNTEIVGQSIQFGPRENGNSGGSNRQNQQSKSNKKEKDEEIPVIEEDEDIDVEDIPF